MAIPAEVSELMAQLEEAASASRNVAEGKEFVKMSEEFLAIEKKLMAAIERSGMGQ